MNENKYKLAEGEYRFAEVVWKHEPVNSTQLVKLCENALGWKKATTYTVLRKLCERGILQNDAAIVTALVKQEQVLRYETEALLERSFDNSLPMFVAAFLQDRRLSAREAEELKRMIDASLEQPGDDL